MYPIWYMNRNRYISLRFDGPGRFGYESPAARSLRLESESSSASQGTGGQYHIRSALDKIPGRAVTCEGRRGVTQGSSNDSPVAEALCVRKNARGVLCDVFASQALFRKSCGASASRGV